ncbi:hypothetical protein FIBSPDRAFT_850900 [Athelia psychrophila]|uniref:Uncharacterized protein n=1 Tax=Athelia psychrophila TaxID=1759441 RepID=A0A166T459_9AGAM|nr:hypothetical protein FIBSPDRAFT_850900 [Fibularhizoctonia sp. CBS 109695]
MKSRLVHALPTPCILSAHCTRFPQLASIGYMQCTPFQRPPRPAPRPPPPPGRPPRGERHRDGRGGEGDVGGGGDACCARALKMRK